MAGTLNVTVQDATGTGQADALVRVYEDTANGPVLQGTARTPSNGDPVSFSVPAGDYRIHVDPISTTYLDQWYGGGDAYTAPAIPVADAGTVDIDFILQLPVDPRAAESRPMPLFWKDTTANEILVLYPGQEREAFNNPESDFYQHVLVGPFLSSAKAAAA